MDYEWEQLDGSDNPVNTVTLSAPHTATPSFIVPALSSATDVQLGLFVIGKGDQNLLYATISLAEFTIRGLAPTALAVVSEPIEGDTYKRDETIEVAITFGDRVLVAGTPQLALSVGTNSRTANYVRGSNSNRLVFEYTVLEADTDTDGILVGQNALALNGGAITSVYGAQAILAHAELATQTGHKVNGATAALTGGVCARTPQVRDKLVELVKVNHATVINCSLVNPGVHLPALTGTLDLRIASIATLKRGDFLNLGGIAILRLLGNDLTALPEGVFAGLDDTLTELWLNDNDLQTIAAGVFDGLTRLTSLTLHDNDLSSLPPRIFEKLTNPNLRLSLHGNPGTTRFVPTAKAGPEGGFEVASGGSVTLGVEGAENGYNDPWGTNVTYAWTQTEGTTGTLTNDTNAQATFTAPTTSAEETHGLRLTVTGNGGNFSATADTVVQVAAQIEPPQGLGICARTPAVQAAILERVNEGANNLQCAGIDTNHLKAITGRLDVSDQVSTHGRMTALAPGDFSGLSAVTALDLDNHALRVFPSGIFDELTALTELSMAYNQTQASNSLMTLPSGLFDALTSLTTLHLEQNDLERLPDGIFEPLTDLTALTFHGNPGSASFVPVAVAGPEGGKDATAGETVTLGADRTPGPWGNNLAYRWRQSAGTTLTLSPSTNAKRPTFAAPQLTEAEEFEYGLTVTARGTSLTATDSVTVRVAATATVSSVALVSRPVDGVDLYKQGETIEAAVTFTKLVTVTGMPTLDLSVGTNTRKATYDRGTGTNRLVFAYTVESTDADSDGIAIGADSLKLPTDAMIVNEGGGQAILAHAGLATQTGHKVNGATAALTGGVCARTPQVRDKLVELVKVNHATVINCSLVNPGVHLPALTGTLDLRIASIATLKRGDFLNLGGIAILRLLGNDLTALPEGVFAGLDDTLTELWLNDNDLQTIAAGVFDGLTRLTSLTLHDNDLSSLPPRIFEKLTNPNLRLSLHGNPGTARFVPTAKAGPEGGIEVASGRKRNPRSRRRRERLRRSLGR